MEDLNRVVCLDGITQAHVPTTREQHTVDLLMQNQVVIITTIDVVRTAIRLVRHFPQLLETHTSSASGSLTIRVAQQWKLPVFQLLNITTKKTTITELYILLTESMFSAITLNTFLFVDT